MQTKPVIIGLIGWMLLAFFSVINYPAIFRSECYFQSSWIFCSENLSDPLKVLSFVLITGSIMCFVYAGFSLFRSWRKGEELPRFFSRFVWVYIFLAFLVVPFGSGDTSYYFSIGKAINSGVNPYVENWTLQRHFVAPNHLEATSGFSYGPLTGLLFWGTYKMSFDNPAVFFFIWKLLVLIGLVLVGLISHNILGLLGISRSKSDWVVFWLSQPLLAFESLSSGHFDVIWVVFLLLAILCAIKRWWPLAFFMIFIGVWIKFIPLLTLPFFVLWWWQGVNWGNWLKQIGYVVVSVVLSAVVTVSSWWLFWKGYIVFDSIILQSKWAVSSAFAVAYYSLKPMAVALFNQNAHWYLTRSVHALLLMVLVYFILPYIKIGLRIVLKKQTLSDIGFIQFISVSLLLYLCIWQKSFWPWYPLWLLPLGLIVFAQTKNQLWGKLWNWLSIAPFGFYPVWLINWILFRTDAVSNLWFWWFTVLLVWAYPISVLIKLRKNNFNLLVE